MTNKFNLPIHSVEMELNTNIPTIKYNVFYDVFTILKPVQLLLKATLIFLEYLRNIKIISEELNTSL